MRSSLLLCCLWLLLASQALAAASEKPSAATHRQSRYHKIVDTPDASTRKVMEEWRSQMRSARREGPRASSASVAKTGGIAQTMQKFPHQLDDYVYLTSAPVALANGNVLFLWSTEDTLFATQSSDGAQTWGARQVVGTASSYIYEVTAVQRTNGTILVVMEVDAGIDWVSSTDNGATWTSPSRIGGTTGAQYEPSLTEATDGTLFLAYATDGSSSSDVALRSSTDGGATWGTQKVFSATTRNEFAPTIVSGNGTTLLALYMIWNGTSYDIMKRTSTDGGAIWSAAMAALSSPTSEYRPRAARQNDGTLHLVFIRDETSPTFPQITWWWELYSTTSTDGGATWGSPARFTHYVADDGIQNITLLNGQPLVTFQSSRGQELFMRQLWYGIVGSTVDSDAPPVTYPFLGTTGALKSSSPTFLTAGADDETGVSAVSVRLKVNGVETGSLPMFDDGAHGDGTAGDGIWGAEVTGLQPLDTLVYALTVTDIDNNTVAGNLVFGSFALALPVHATGSLTLAVQPRGVLGAINPFTGFPRGLNASYDGLEYLYTGGLAVGSRVGPGLEKRVSAVLDPFVEDGDWRRSQGTAITTGPGVSDDDIMMTYDDAGSPSRLGLQVTETSYHWVTETRNDFVIFRYAITNTGQQGSLSEVHASFVMDADIALGESPGDDLARFDATRGLLYMYDSQMNPSGYIGMLWLDGGLPAVANAPTTFSITTEAQLYDAMTTNTPPGTPPPADYLMLLTAPAFPLDSGNTTTVAFGLVMGQDLQDLQANADTMKAIYAGTVVSVDEGAGNSLPREYALDQNYPNPFNPSTTIRYHLPQTSLVRLDVYNTVGQLVRVLVDGEQAGGVHSIRFEADGLPSGVYFYRLSAGTFTATNKLMLMR